MRRDLVLNVLVVVIFIVGWTASYLHFGTAPTTGGGSP